MSDAWARISQWNEGYLNDAADDVRTLRQRILDLQSKLETEATQLSSKGQAAEEIRRNLHHLAADAGRLVKVTSDAMMALADASNDVWTLRTMIMECEQTADINALIIGPDGTVSFTREPDQGLVEDVYEWAMSQLPFGKRNALQNDVNRALSFAAELDDDLYSKLWRLKFFSPFEMNNEGSSFHSPGLPNLPQPDWSANEVAQWWSTLSESDKQWLVDHHPEMIGNLDGVEYSWRHKANVARIDDLLADAEKELERLRAEGAEDDWGSFNSDSPFKLQQGRVDDLKKIKDMFLSGNADPDRSLIALDVTGHRVKAAVATGDLDNADDVAVFVPGMGTRVADNLDSYVADAERIRNQSIRSLPAGSPRNVASVAWLGYDAPGAPRTDNYKSAASTTLAHQGADRLVAFTEGMEATHRANGGRDAHLTVIGHSYGSTTTGFAAAKVSPGVIDDIVLFGSPGSGVHSVKEYNITSGTPYVAGVPDRDWVQGLGWDVTFGVNPMTAEGFEHLSDYSPVPGSTFDPLSRHGTNVYLDKDSWILRDIGKVVIGVKP